MAPSHPGSGDEFGASLKPAGRPAHGAGAVHAMSRARQAAPSVPRKVKVPLRPKQPWQLCEAELMSALVFFSNLSCKKPHFVLQGCKFSGFAVGVAVTTMGSQSLTVQCGRVQQCWALTSPTAAGWRQWRRLGNQSTKAVKGRARWHLAEAAGTAGLAAAARPGRVLSTSVLPEQNLERQVLQTQCRRLEAQHYSLSLTAEQLSHSMAVSGTLGD